MGSPGPWSQLWSLAPGPGFGPWPLVPALVPGPWSRLWSLVPGSWSLVPGPGFGPCRETKYYDPHRNTKNIRRCIALPICRPQPRRCSLPFALSKKRHHNFRTPSPPPLSPPANQGHHRHIASDSNAVETIVSTSRTPAIRGKISLNAISRTCSMGPGQAPHKDGFDAPLSLHEISPPGRNGRRGATTRFEKSFLLRS